MVGTEYLERMKDAERRYEARTTEREDALETIGRRGVLHGDDPKRVTDRLSRLGVDWTMATALERMPPGPSTGRSLGDALAPRSFGADLLGLERLMGRNDLIDVGFLEAGYLASRPVGRVAVGGRDAHYGTGFLISPELLLTNNHVLRDEQEAARGVIEFDFQAGTDGQALVPVRFNLEPERFFATDATLDFTVVAVSGDNPEGGRLDTFGWLPLIEAQGKAILGEIVNIIQHPNGEPKQAALRENQVVDLLELFVHYRTDTCPGSSGSPVFNDQWEVVALHHAGVPATDADGNYLTTDGTRWTPEMGEHRLAWKANEGVRVSRVLGALRELQLTGSAAQLRDRIFESAHGPQPRPAPASAAAPALALNGARPGTPDGAAAAHWTVPLHITVSAGAPSAPDGPALSVSPAAAPSVARPAAANGTAAGSAPAAAADIELRAALVDLEVGLSRPYYDAQADRAASEAYYAHVRHESGAALARALTRLLESTHERRPAYKPMRLVYPWVDLHPDRQLRSIYSGRTFTAEEFVRADAAAEAARTARWQELLLRESAPGPAELAEKADALEAALPFNCEHVVPQSWFGKREPMRGDLHHLFACESGCNSFRGNTPYFDFAEREEVVRHACGRREADRFEPSAGKGPVARATLYFLLRYPGQVGDAARELRADRLDLLLAWHGQDPVSEYERHRNAAAAEIQGNRNPLVDHPDWAGRIDFSDVWAAQPV